MLNWSPHPDYVSAFAPLAVEGREMEANETSEVGAPFNLLPEVMPLNQIHGGVMPSCHEQHLLTYWPGPDSSL